MQELFPAWFKAKLVFALVDSLSQHTQEQRQAKKCHSSMARCSGWPTNQFIDLCSEGATLSFLNDPPQALRQILFLFGQDDQITLSSGLPRWVVILVADGSTWDRLYRPTCLLVAGDAPDLTLPKVFKPADKHLMYVSSINTEHCE